LPIWKNIRQRVCVDGIWLLHPDFYGDLHRFFGQTIKFSEVDRIVPKRVLQRPSRRLRVILTAQRCAHAEFG
jgi:hypothetical protein